MQAESCWRSVGRRWSSQNASPSGSVYGLSLAFGPLASVSQPLGRSRLQRPWSTGRLNCHGWVASGPLQRLVTGWRTRRRTRLQPQVLEDLLDHGWLQDRRNDPEIATAVRAVLVPASAATTCPQGSMPKCACRAKRVAGPSQPTARTPSTNRINHADIALYVHVGTAA